MAGATAALTAAGCSLVGGHTSEGAELALGFAVNAVVSTTAMLRKVSLKIVHSILVCVPLRCETKSTGLHHPMIMYKYHHLRNAIGLARRIDPTGR